MRTLNLLNDWVVGSNLPNHEAMLLVEITHHQELFKAIFHVTLLSASGLFIVAVGRVPFRLIQIQRGWFTN